MIFLISLLLIERFIIKITILIFNNKLNKAPAIICILLKPKKDVKRVLDITKMSSKINIVTDEDEAIEFLLG